MTPELQIGDIVIVKNVKENEINEGDMYFMKSEKVRSRRNKRRLKRLAYEQLRRKDE